MGSCGDVAPLLGAFLHDQGAGTFSSVFGMRGEGNNRRSHAWLEGEGLIVDITADQFDEVTERVIVAEHSDWHATFDTEVMHEGDHRTYDEVTADELDGVYRQILKHVKGVNV